MIVLPPLIRSLMKRDWRGHEHMPATGGVIVAANHLSIADWLAVALFCYEAGRYPVFLIKSPVFGVKIIGTLLRKVGQLPVYRGQADAALVLEDAERAIVAGACVVFYPEGTATRDPQLWPMAAKTGAARLALSAGAPVIPVAHWGAQDILPYGTKKLRLFPRRKMRMLAGPPVDLSEYRDKPLDAATLRGATGVIMRDITELLAQLRGARPPAVPYDRRTAQAADATASAQATKAPRSAIATEAGGNALADPPSSTTANPPSSTTADPPSSTTPDPPASTTASAAP